MLDSLQRIDRSLQRLERWLPAASTDGAESRRLQEEADALSRSLPAYIRAAWPIVEPGTSYVPGWHLDAIAEHLTAVTDGEIRNLIINIPPRHMKSLTVAVFWFSWVWTWWPESRWLFGSYAEALAIRDSLKCRRIIQSGWYQQRWGEMFALASDQNQKKRFENDQTGYRVSIGVGGVATGEGGDFLVVDDPLKAGDAYSAAIRSEANRWWDETMSTRGNDPQQVAKVVIMQRLHEQDLTGHLLEKMATGGEHYEHLRLPAEYEPSSYVSAIGWQDPRSQAGELLWPERFDRTSLGNLKAALGSQAAAGQLQQRPAAAEGNLFQRTWWRFWRPGGAILPPVRIQMADGRSHEATVDELPGALEWYVQSWDMSFQKSADSSFVVGQVWAGAGADRYLLDQVRERLDFLGAVEAVRKLSANWPQTGSKFVEDKANGPAIIQSLRREIAGLTPVSPDGSKEARAHAVSPQVEAGNVYLPHPHLAPWVWDFIEECSNFPAAAHDDQVDAMSQALNKMGQPRKKMRAGTVNFYA